MTITPETIELLKRLEAAATPEPWRAMEAASLRSSRGVETLDPDLCALGDEIVLPPSSATEDDLLFIAAARNHLRELIEWGEELQTKCRNLTKQLDDQLGTPCEQILHDQEMAQANDFIDRWVYLRGKLEASGMAFKEGSPFTQALNYLAVQSGEITSLRTQLADAKAEIERLREELHRMRLRYQS